MRCHLPSLALGVVAAILLGTLIAAGRPPLPCGRFAIEATHDHVFVLDTESGKVWQKFIPENAGQTDPDFAHPKPR